MHLLTMHRESATLGTTVLPAALAEGLVESRGIGEVVLAVSRLLFPISSRTTWLG